MKNFKELKEELIDNDYILDEMVKYVEQSHENNAISEITCKNMMKEFKRIHRETFKRIIEEMSIRVSEIDLEIESLKDEKRSIELFTPYHVEKGFKKGA